MEQHKNGYKQETSVDSADISKSVERFKVLKSFAGTLPADFDYEKELETMRDEKYACFN